MDVESYPSVHQLVSTVRGRLADGRHRPCEALRALFPAGSMTGAPKLRTMQVIDEVEDTPRGVYAGAFGWLAGDGRADLGVVIRSLMTDGRRHLPAGHRRRHHRALRRRGGVRRVALEGRTPAVRPRCQSSERFPATTRLRQPDGDPLAALEVVDAEDHRVRDEALLDEHGHEVVVGLRGSTSASSAPATSTGWCGSRSTPR